jgi:hypothetical protein
MNVVSSGSSSPTLSTLFDDSEKIKKILNKNYFPKGNEERNTAIKNLALVRLAYLVRMGTDDKKSPFTERGQEILRSSNRRNTMTVCGLWVGLVTTMIGTASLGYLSLAYDEDNSTGEKAGFLTLGAVGNMAGIALAYWATGFAPHIASNSNNRQQDMLLGADRMYEDLGYKLIELYFTSGKRALAVEIAQKIDCDKIQRKIGGEIGSPSRAGLMLSRLKEAAAYINSQDTDDEILPECTQFRHFILQLSEKSNV